MSAGNRGIEQGRLHMLARHIAWGFLELLLLAQPTYPT